MFLERFFDGVCFYNINKQNLCLVVFAESQKYLLFLCLGHQFPLKQSLQNSISANFLSSFETAKLLIVIIKMIC